MDLKEVKERMQNGKLYFPTDEALLSEQAEYMEILYDFNNTRPSEGEKRAELLKKLLGGVGKNCYVEPPLHANWGCNTYMGDDVYANFNLTLVDDVKITIGNHVMFAPNVTISAAGHPVEPGLRYRQAQYNLPVTIGDNVWIGAGTVILPGVSIGDNTVVGAGSIVTRSIPANVVAAGNPCRVIRRITDADKKYYYKDREFDPESWAKVEAVEIGE